MSYLYEISCMDFITASSKSLCDFFFAYLFVQLWTHSQRVQTWVSPSGVLYPPKS